MSVCMSVPGRPCTERVRTLLCSEHSSHKTFLLRHGHVQPFARSQKMHCPVQDAYPLAWDRCVSLLSKKERSDVSILPWKMEAGEALLHGGWWAGLCRRGP